MNYPHDWPKCPNCGDFALDGHITCGRVECDESGHRNARADAYAARRRRHDPNYDTLAEKRMDLE